MVLYHGRGFPRSRPPVMGARHMRPHRYEPEFIPPFGLPRGNFIRPPMRPPMLPLPPRMLHPPPPPRPRIPLPHIPLREMPFSPVHAPARSVGFPPTVPPGPPLRLMRPQLPLRGRGMFHKRGATVKRLVPSNGLQVKKNMKRKEKTEEMEINKPWVTEVLKSEIQKKYKLCEIAKEKKTEVDWQAYRNQKALVGKITNIAKLEYIGSHPEAAEFEFFCETCDRGWKTEEKLQEHVAQHQVCGRDGCTFTAHPKVVLKHVQIQHDTGLYRRINMEDVAKWIAERKSRYPTKENKERKESLMNEMTKRGERIPTKEKRFPNKQTHGNRRDKWKSENVNFKKSEEGFKHNHNLSKLRKTCENSQWRDPNAWRGDLPQFPGIAAFPPEEENVNKAIDNKENFSDDDEWSASRNVVKSESQNTTVSNTLASLMINYGSDMSDEDEETICAPKIETSIPLVCNEAEKARANTNTTLEENKLPLKLENEKETQDGDSDSGPDECVIEHEDKSNIPILEGKEVKEKEISGEDQDVIECLNEDAKQDRCKNAYVRTPLKRHQLSLLEKLLKNEIVHERNVILQCVRYIVKNDFIGCGSLEKTQSVDILNK